jgi:hypothetical protein
LSRLLHDESEFNKFFEKLACVQTMKRVRDDLRSTNEDFASKYHLIDNILYNNHLPGQNLAKEDEINKLRAEVESLRSTVTSQQIAFEAKVQRQQEVMKVNYTIHI